MSKTNTVLTIPDAGRVALKEVPYPHIAPGFALVRVMVAPICIEHQIYRDHTFEWHEDEENLGHEGVGIIEEVAEGSKFSVGDRVVIYQGNPCGSCFVCEQGLSPTHCMAIPYEDMTGSGGGDPHALLDSLGGAEAMTTKGGMRSIEIECGSESGGFGFSTHRIAPEGMIQKIPDQLHFRYAAAANCSNGCTYTGVEEVGVGQLGQADPPRHQTALTDVLEEHLEQTAGVARIRQPARLAHERRGVVGGHLVQSPGTDAHRR